MIQNSNTGRIVGGIEYEEYIAPEPPKRLCTSCDKPVSRYNPESTCNVCKRKVKDLMIRHAQLEGSVGSRERTVFPREKPCRR